MLPKPPSISASTLRFKIAPIPLGWRHVEELELLPYQLLTIITYSIFIKTEHKPSRKHLIGR